MTITKAVAVIIQDQKYLIARDTDEDFFKNVGGRIERSETEFNCLKRNLQSEIGMTLTSEPELIFDFPPTPAVGNPGDEVILRGYLIKDKIPATFTFNGNVSEVAWVDSHNVQKHKVTPQIGELIIPKLTELGLVT